MVSCWRTVKNNLQWKTRINYEAGKVSETSCLWQMMHWLVALLLAEQWHVVWWLLLLFPDVL